MTRISQQECRDILEFRKGDMGLSEEELKEKLSSAGFEYDKDRNQFI